MKREINLVLCLILTLILLNSCATIPPEFLTSMEKERDGILLLKERHEQTVRELTDNWYNERLERLVFIKQLELDKLTLNIDDPDGEGMIEVLKKNELLNIEKSFSEAIVMANKIRNVLVAGYADTDNWGKLQKLHSINLDMTRSLNELNKAQRSFYSELVGNNVPYPSDLLNSEAKKLLNQ